jgi:hypothetical protein
MQNVKMRQTGRQTDGHSDRQVGIVRGQEGTDLG